VKLGICDKEASPMSGDWSRRKFLKFAGLGTLGVAGSTLLQACSLPVQGLTNSTSVKVRGGHDISMHHAAGANAAATASAPMTYGDFDPTAYLTHFDTGNVVGKTADGRTIREFTVVSEDKEIEIFPGVIFPAWTFNGTVPGPTLRCTEGDLIRIHYTNNGEHPHSIHLHGIHPPDMDGLPAFGQGGRFTYEFTAEPFGVLPYHCHVMPLTKHIAKGLYGTLIVDPKEGRPPAKEMVMIMNGFDLDFDGGNEFYTVNGVPFHYQNYPIQVKVGELLRIYLVNMTEFDLVNSYHQHAAMFKYYPNGTSMSTDIFTDTVTLGQGERGILEMTLKWPGKYMFHAHQSEFAELGWIGFFEASA
jgi:FtsP/CotA-like multicopper oxidase with cupredoxin domain